MEGLGDISGSEEGRHQIHVCTLNLFLVFFSMLHSLTHSSLRCIVGSFGSKTSSGSSCDTHKTLGLGPCILYEEG